MLCRLTGANPCCRVPKSAREPSRPRSISGSTFDLQPSLIDGSLYRPHSRSANHCYASSTHCNIKDRSTPLPTLQKFHQRLADLADKYVRISVTGQVFQANGRRGRKKKLSICVHTSSPPTVELPEKTVSVLTRLQACFRRAPMFCSRGFSTPQRAASLKSNSPPELASYYRFLLRDGGGEKCSYFSAGRHHPEGRAEDGSGGVGRRGVKRGAEERRDGGGAAY